MKIGRNGKGILILTFFLIYSVLANGQLTAPGSVFTEMTNYPVYRPQDNIHIFCTAQGSSSGQLKVITGISGIKTFDWKKFNPAIGAFDPYFSENTSSGESSLSNLADGCYQVEIVQGEVKETYRAWVLNNWHKLSASVTDSDCESFKLSGEIENAPLKYRDLANNTEIELNRDLKVEWKDNQTIVARVINPQIVDPPTKDTEYSFNVSDRFGCESTVKTTYVSIVTKAGFTANPIKGEAPLDVNFSNLSQNGDPDGYEWFIFKDLDVIKRESEKSDTPIDSIMIVFYDVNPVYTFENSGTYQVKLVSKKVTQLHTCTDTFYLPDYIIADTSFIAAPNVFTPNGDGNNDEFVVKFWSMQDIKISIFNRWGKAVQVWSKNNIRGFENTWEESVWDGKVGGRYASPGVYYYVVEGKGRDGRNRWAHGFFHLFRGKD